MKTTLEIAKTELRVLFYSPVAWLIIVIFALQTGMVYTSLFDQIARRDILGQITPDITNYVFNSSPRGFFLGIQTYIYLYIPLLTMNVISREFSSGSVKLLYSSPINNYQIVLGKYLALVVFALVLVGILSVFCFHAFISIENFDTAPVLAGLLGIFLLICSYAAIGLFMSAVSSYTVVAAIGTLAILALLNLMKGWWQDIAIVRDVTYWIAIGGRSNSFVSGLIATEDLIYFFIVIFMFIGFTITKLNVERKKATFFNVALKYVSIFFIACTIGYFSSLPQLKFYYDATYSKVNTIVEGSQKVIEKIKGPLTIHTYVNMLDRYFSYGVPKFYKREAERFEKYQRFKPDISLKQTHYYHRADYPYLEMRFPNLTDKERVDSLRLLNKWNFPIKSYDEISKEVDLSDENYRFVHVLEAANGKRVFLRIFDDMVVHPTESEITSAFKRIIMDLPKIGFVSGHNERISDSNKDRDYNMVTEEKKFRYSLLNQGFDFENVNLSNEVASDIRILFIADPRKAYTNAEMINLKKYIDQGGNMVLAGEPGSRDNFNQIANLIGVNMLPGTLVQDNKDIQSDIILSSPSLEGLEFSHHLKEMNKGKYGLLTISSAPLRFDSSKGFSATTLFRSKGTGVWLEKSAFNEIDSLPQFNPEIGEEEAEFPLVLALTRNINNKDQKILVTGDADWLSNKELGTRRPNTKAANYFLISTAFYWLSDGEVPIDLRHKPAIDNQLFYSKQWDWIENVIKLLFPILLAIVGLLIWIRRRGH